MRDLYLIGHQKFVYFAQRYRVKVIKRIAPNVRTINYVTDGGPAHFKNRYNILNLTHHEIDFNVPAVWTFSATSHGKGPVDGLGAALKSTATRYLMRHDPEESFKILREFYDFSKQQQERHGHRLSCCTWTRMRSHSFIKGGRLSDG